MVFRPNFRGTNARFDPCGRPCLAITRGYVCLQARLRQMFPLRCATAQYHQTIWAGKADSGALATFQKVGKVGKQGEAV